VSKFEAVADPVERAPTASHVAAGTAAAAANTSRRLILRTGCLQVRSVRRKGLVFIGAGIVA
jgi:hypothetical protein